MKTQIKLTIDSKEIQYLCNKDKRLAKVISIIGPLSYETNDNPYEFLIHEIIEQMLSIKASKKIFYRLKELCNDHITPESISVLTDAQIKSIGTTSSKVTYIRNVTEAILNRTLDLDSLITMNDTDVFNTLTSIKGIGKWTANMYLMFILNRQDILPTNDVAFIQAYKWLYNAKDCSDASIRKKCKKWKPYSSIATRYLYQALDTGLTKETFHLYK